MRLFALVLRVNSIVSKTCGLVTPDWQRSGARHLQVMLRLFSFVGG